MCLRHATSASQIVIHLLVTQVALHTPKSFDSDSCIHNRKKKKLGGGYMGPHKIVSIIWLHLLKKGLLSPSSTQPLKMLHLQEKSTTWCTQCCACQTTSINHRQHPGFPCGAHPIQKQELVHGVLHLPCKNALFCLKSVALCFICHPKRCSVLAARVA